MATGFTLGSVYQNHGVLGPVLHQLAQQNKWENTISIPARKVLLTREIGWKIPHSKMGLDFFPINAINCYVVQVNGLCPIPEKNRHSRRELWQMFP